MGAETKCMIQANKIFGSAPYFTGEFTQRTPYLFCCYGDVHWL